MLPITSIITNKDSDQENWDDDAKESELQSPQQTPIAAQTEQTEEPTKESKAKTKQSVCFFIIHERLKILTETQWAGIKLTELVNVRDTWISEQSACGHGPNFIGCIFLKTSSQGWQPFKNQMKMEGQSKSMGIKSDFKCNKVKLINN